MSRDGGAAAVADDEDRGLIRAIAQGDERALEALYAHHWRSLFSYLIQQLGDYQLAEEVVQDVMWAAWAGASGFRQECRVRTWLFAIARKRATAARERRGSIPITDEDPLSEGLRFVPHDQHLGAYQDVLAALDQLPCPERETVVLVFYHGLSGPEVAQVMGVPQGTVRSRLRRAKVRLGKLLSTWELTDA